MKLTISIAAIAGMVATPLFAQDAAPVAPRLIVAISVDQFSADLFAEYRGSFTGGVAKLSREGAVFPSGYQAHAATETCPGNSTILTGSNPARTGIIANDWMDLSAAREDKTIYCAEDERVPGSSSEDYTVSPVHLKVPVMGERMKAMNPASRTVSVAGKDRAAVMMGGHAPDQIWWWGGKAYVSYPGKTSAAADRVNASVTHAIAEARPALPLTPLCQPRSRAIPIEGGSVGDGRFARATGDARAFRASPESDGATLALAAALIDEMKLGQGTAPDILSIGLSATDYIGHGFGTEGSEMCLQMGELDRSLGDFFARLDGAGIDYAVVLTADHGGQDMPERLREQGAPDAQRMSLDLAPKAVSARVAKALGLTGDVLFAAGGDIYASTALSPANKARVIAETKRQLLTHPQVQAVFTKAEIAATPIPTTTPDSWSLIEEARASFDAQRSGDLLLLLKPRVTPIPVARAGSSVATHGSPWIYDRRVPILFWRKNMVPFEQSLAIRTVDILPTLAPLVGLPVAAAEIDGVCRDLDAGAATTCR